MVFIVKLLLTASSAHRSGGRPSILVISVLPGDRGGLVKNAATAIQVL
jgi:hypothetical protein